MGVELEHVVEVLGYDVRDCGDFLPGNGTVGAGAAVSVLYRGLSLRFDGCGAVYWSGDFGAGV